MKYFIVKREDAKDFYYEKCEPSILTATGSCCGQYTVFIFKDENVPKELKNPMTKEEFEKMCEETKSWALDK